MSDWKWYHFGPFRFDGRLAYRGDELLELPEREARVLLLLLESAGHLVKKQELLDVFGPRADPNNVDQAVTRLRKVLNDRNSDRPRRHVYIETVQGDGYVFKHRVHVAYETRPEVLVEYYAGLEWWSSRKPDAMRKAKECFEGVLDHAPTFARNHAALADCYATLGSHLWMSPREAGARAKAAAEKALLFDKSLAEPHATLGFVYSLFEHKWSDAERELTLAIERAPNYGSAHHRYALHLAAWGERTRALEEIAHAKELDPLGRTIGVHIATILWWFRRYDEAEEQCTEALTIDPNFWYLHHQLGLIREQQGRPEEAIAEQRRAIELAREPANVLTAALARAYALGGARDESLRILRDITGPKAPTRPAFFHVATAYAALGEVDLAIEYLSRASEEQECWVSFLAIDPRLDVLRHAPNFSKLLARLDLVQRL
jgi:DNA-binding winged helix-turn-helix (wHTH) protein/Tfp pilus assembly protein PilF